MEEERIFDYAQKKPQNREIDVKRRPATAWMLRRDGNAFPVIQHIYAAPDEVEESLYAAEWLYRHTQDAAARELVLDFIVDWACQMQGGKDREVPIPDRIHQEIQKRKYIFLTGQFVDEIAEKLEERMAAGKGLESYNCQVAECLNREFLRARYGGMYHTISGCCDMYFRISSGQTDWMGIICGFLRERKESVDTVTVLWDEESTGRSEYFQYMTEDGCRDICKVLPEVFLEWFAG